MIDNDEVPIKDSRFVNERIIDYSHVNLGLPHYSDFLATALGSDILSIHAVFSDLCQKKR